MADTYTPNYNLRKQDPDTIADITEVNGNFDLIDSAMKTIDTNRVNGDTTSTNATNALDLRLDVLDTNAVAAGDFLSGAAALAISAGWTLSVAGLYRRGKFVLFTAQVVKTTPALSGTSDGNLGNVSIGLIPSGWRPLTEVGIAPRATGPMWGGYVNPGGTFAICSFIPNTAVAIGTTLTGSVMYLIS